MVTQPESDEIKQWRTHHNVVALWSRVYPVNLKALERFPPYEQVELHFKASRF